MKLATFELVISGPEWETQDAERHDTHAERLRFFANLPAMLEETEENLTDLAPEGYQVRITRRD